MLVRPWHMREVIPVGIAAALLVAIGAVSVRAAWSAIVGGYDVYFFLAGMMLLAEIARQRGLFDWLAARAVAAARGSRPRLFAIVYVVGAFVTIFFSNDATAVVLTPAVAAAVARARVAPLPHLFACAFIANAASFVLPISNPANLVIYGTKLPTLLAWIVPFALPSLAAIVVTFAVIRFLSRVDLRGEMADSQTPPRLDVAQKRTAIAIAFAASALVLASCLGWPVGLVTFACGAAALVLSVLGDVRLGARMLSGIDVPILGLVAGLFVLVDALTASGALHLAEGFFDSLVHLPRVLANLAGATSVGVLSNVANNLPVGLAMRAAAASLHGHDTFVRAGVIGVDLGPNLSVTGSLATILWMNALRRANVPMDAWMFVRIGLVAMPLALLAATLVLQ